MTAADRGAQKEWDYFGLCACLFIGAVLQAIVLSEMSYRGDVMALFALAFDLCVAARVFIAFLRKEKGRAWIAYAVLTCSSPFWIRLLFDFYS